MSSKSYEELPESEQHSTASVLTTFWHMPSITVARFTLASYIRSGWILLDIVFIWLLYAAFFYSFGGNVAYFFGIAAEGMLGLAILSTVILVRRAMSANVYLPLSRLRSRSSYVQGVVFVATLLRVPEYLLFMLLAMGYHEHIPILGIQGANVSNMLVGSIGVLIDTICIATLTVVFSAPIATRRARIVLLAWLVAVLYSSTSPDVVAQVLKVTQLPLMPLEICYGLGAAGDITIVGLGAIVLVAVYIVALLALGQWWMSRRDLILH